MIQATLKINESNNQKNCKERNTWPLRRPTFSHGVGWARCKLSVMYTGLFYQYFWIKWNDSPQTIKHWLFKVQKINSLIIISLSSIAMTYFCVMPPPFNKDWNDVSAAIHTSPCKMQMAELYIFWNFASFCCLFSQAPLGLRKLCGRFFMMVK